MSGFSKDNSIEGKVAQAMWDSLSGDTHTGVPLDDRIPHQQERMKRMAKAAIAECERQLR